MGGIVMTGAQNNYDVLRWDGTCVSIMAARATLGEACAMSATATSADKACDKADKAFAQAIVESVRGGTALPAPARRP